jgi:hypothetical protein
LWQGSGKPEECPEKSEQYQDCCEPVYRVAGGKSGHIIVPLPYRIVRIP